MNLFLSHRVCCGESVMSSNDLASTTIPDNCEPAISRRSNPMRRTKEWIQNNIPLVRLRYNSFRKLFRKSNKLFGGGIVATLSFLGIKAKRKPRICILADAPGWAYDTSARQIKQQLAREFDITIRYAVDEPSFSSVDYDLLHICFWGENCYKSLGFDRERIVKEISSLRWQDDPCY